MSPPRSPPPARPYDLSYPPASAFAPDAHTLACLRFGAAAPAADDARLIAVALPQLQAQERLELWRSAAPVEHARNGPLAWAHNGDVLFGHYRTDEGTLADAEAAAYEAYRTIDALLRARGYPAWLRVWIFLQDLHAGEGDAERYRAFCVGRHRALARSGFEAELPAATAVGTRAGGLLICFLAARHAGIQVENPRQVSAFRYPRQYAPVGPSFSRATLMRWADRTQLFVSGTASIVGHESLHPDDPRAQLAELRTNIRALAQHARARHGLGEAPFRAEGVKLYLRDRAALPVVEQDIGALFEASVPLMILEGDICRRELQVEAEVTYVL